MLLFIRSPRFFAGRRPHPERAGRDEGEPHPDAVDGLRHARTHAAVDQIARTFNLDRTAFTTITSEAFGYTGVLTLFHPDRLHRFEVITPIDMAKTMGRYYGREGASYYMAFAESREMPLIERLAGEAGAGITLDRPDSRDPALTADQLWLHPATLGGMMLGVSRPTMAWRWSGKPERVEAI